MEVDQVLDRLRDLGQPRRVKKGSVLLSEGDPIEGFFWLIEGTLRVFQMNLDGREFEVARFGSGEWVAPALALTTDRFPHFLVALQPSRLLFFPRAKALERITHDAKLSAHFLALLAARCHLLHQRLNTLQLHTLKDRLEQYLLQECPHDGSCRVQLPMPKKELARVLATTPESLSRTLRQLEREGRIEMTGRTIRVVQCGRKCP
jgi:CRP/FNR family transcriptional regulator, dissimilatory nitrate respiration regulator